ncbi:MAG: 5-formyltetrahydrofolate cyclo-ligase [Rhodothermales bacterium]|nr:5-formyltetrahydrofolate cyclo-ligase [Rhodothermales bacterium]
MRHRLAMLSADDVARQSLRVTELLAGFDEVLDAESVFAFWPMAGEVDLRPLLGRLQERGVLVGLPAVVPDVPGQMVFRQFTGAQDLRANRWGLLEPTGAVIARPPTTFLVPCLAITRTGRRLGHGGGYYDRFLARSGAHLIAPILNPQLVPEVPTEPHDQFIGTIVTPNEVIHAQTRA